MKSIIKAIWEIIRKSFPHYSFKEKLDLNANHLNGGKVKRLREGDCDVRTFISTRDEVLNRVIKRNKLDLGTYDERALKCLNYVIKTIKYVPDERSRNKLTEFWSYPSETLYWKDGDCEDGSILLASLMICAGIPEERVRIACGNVVDPAKQKMFGHAYVLYYQESYDNWRIMDWCFYPDEHYSNHVEILGDWSKPLADDKYKNRWYSFNSKYVWDGEN